MAHHDSVSGSGRLFIRINGSRFNVKSEIVLSSTRIRQIHPSIARDDRNSAKWGRPWMQWVTWEVLFQRLFETFRDGFAL
jgi:hypothetical protein